MARFFVLLLFSALLSFAAASAPMPEDWPENKPEITPENEPAGCVYGETEYEIGETFSDLCIFSCTCGKDGQVSCVLAKKCCVYADSQGNTHFAEIGEVFNDGCNEGCVCTEKKKYMNHGPWTCSTNRKCSCRFKTWQSLFGYAESGSRVPVYDHEGDQNSDGFGCNKYCTCKAEKSGGEEKIDCQGEPCVE